LRQKTITQKQGFASIFKWEIKPPPQIMGHLAIYLDRNFASPQVVYYSDPGSFVESRKWRNMGGGCPVFGRSFRPGVGGPLFGPWPLQDPGPFGGGVCAPCPSPLLLLRPPSRGPPPRYADGSVLQPEGTIIEPSGEIHLADGRILPGAFAAAQRCCTTVLQLAVLAVPDPLCVLVTTHDAGVGTVSCPIFFMCVVVWSGGPD